MKTDPTILVEKVFNNHRKQINFLENYYSERIGHTITIDLDKYAQTSSYHQIEHKIKISADNLIDAYNEFPNLFYSLFYTLMLHEIAHAIYTDRLPFTDTTNILEDNRIEHQVSQWNKRVKFRLLRYVHQDIAFQDYEGKIDNKSNLALALMRTLDNSKFVKQFGDTTERYNIIQEIMALDAKYTSKDYELSKIGYGDEMSELRAISDEVSDLLDKLIESWNKDVKSGKSNDPSQQKKKPEKEEKDLDGGAGSGQGQKPKEDNIPKKEKQELENELSELEQKNRELDKEYDNGIGKLFNPSPNKRKYDQFKISAFTTARRTGIKGSQNMPRHTGTPKGLSMKKYMRRNHVSHEKMFDREMETDMRGGKNARVLFYLDISNSMSGAQRLYTAVRYLKSFYDQMHKHMEIRFMAFGEETYELTRREIEFTYLRPILEGSTRPQAVKTKPHEEVVFITDGQFDTYLPSAFKRKAHFVLVDVPPRIINSDFAGMKNIYPVDSRHVEQGLENATKHLRKMLKRRA